MGYSCLNEIKNGLHIRMKSTFKGAFLREVQRSGKIGVTRTEELSMNAHKKILIIEDNPDISKALSEVLSDCGHTTQMALNGKDGLDHLITHERPDLIILDMFMPVIGGVEFRKRISEIPAFAFIPIIGMSADACGQKRCLSCGIEYFLHKPFELQELLEIVDQVESSKISSAY